MIGPGTYDCTVINARLRNAHTGSLGVSLLVEIEEPDTGQPFRINGDIWITDKAIRMARAQLKALDFDIDAHDLSEINNGVLVGKTCRVMVDLEEFRGEERLKIKRFGEPPPPSPESIAEAQAALRAARHKKEKPEATSQAPDNNAAATPLTDSDIPF